MASPASRRDILKTSAAAASAATLASLDVARFAHAQGSGYIKVGMIGSGGRCTGAAEQALNTGQDVRLVALCDVFEERVQAKLGYLKNAKPGQVEVPADHAFTGFDGYKKVIECSDVVLIACASKFHPFYARAALEAGKHVFVEKPHAIDAAGCRALEDAVALAKEKKRCLVSGLHSRCTPGCREAIRRVHDGAIGEIVAIEENFLRAPYNLVRRKPGQGELLYQFYNWYHFCWLSGDDVIQSLAHNMDRATWALKGMTPAKCHGLGGRSTSFGEVYGDMFDHHGVVYQYPNGVRVYANCCTRNKCHADYSSLILGTKGRCRVTEYGESSIEGAAAWKTGMGKDGHQVEQDELFAAVRAGNVVNHGDYMVPSTWVVLMGQVACYTGQEVTWDQVTKSTFGFGPAWDAVKEGLEPPTKPGPDGNYPIPVPGVTRLL